MNSNPFGNHMPGAQPGQPQQGYAQPGYPAAPAQQQQPQPGWGPPQGAPQQQQPQPGWGPPQGAPQQQPPQQGWGPPQGAPQQQPPQQGWGPPQGAPQPQQPPQGWGPPQGAPQPQQPPQGWGPPQGAPQPQQPQQGYGQQNGAPPGFQQNMPTALPPGVSESGDSAPIIMKPGSFVLEYEKHVLSNQSATLFVFFKIIESDVPEYSPGMTVKWIKKFSEAPGHWKWNKDAGWVLGMVRPLMGFRDQASFQAIAGWDSFLISIIRGEARPELVGRRLRDIVSYQYKDGQVRVDRQRGQPFMAHDWRVI